MNTSEKTYDEEGLRSFAKELSQKLSPGDRVLLEGPLGAGKTTFSKFLLEALGVDQPPEGSPTFAIAHEYTFQRGKLVHIDFYRIRNEEEIEEAGISGHFWDENTIVLSEWTSLWPEFEESILRTGRTFRIWLSFSKNEDPQTRHLRMEVRIQSSCLSGDPAKNYR